MPKREYNTVEKMKRIKQHADFLRYASSAPLASRKHLIHNASAYEMNALCEVCKNIVQGNIPLSAAQKRKLSRHRSTLRTLSNRSVKVKRKKHLLLQKGGLPLLPLLAPLITPLIASLIK